MLERLQSASFKIRSWIYELGAVLGISLATNLAASEIASPSAGYKTWHYSIVVWLVFGITSLYCAQRFREQENIWDKEKASSHFTTVSEWTQSELARHAWLTCIRILIVLSFLLGSILLWQSIIATKQPEKRETKPSPAAKATPTPMAPDLGTAFQ